MKSRTGGEQHEARQIELAYRPERLAIYMLPKQKSSSFKYILFNVFFIFIIYNFLTTGT